MIILYLILLLLYQAEESLRTLHSSIPPQHASKIQVLLRQVQTLHQAPGTSSGSTDGVQEPSHDQAHSDL